MCLRDSNDALPPFYQEEKSFMWLNVSLDVIPSAFSTDFFG
jgi:hypothetical protein